MQIKKISSICFTSSVILLAIIFATNTKVNAQTLIDTTTATGISNTMNSGPAANAPAIRDRIRADLDAKMLNARANQEVRNQMVEGGYKIATSTSPRLPLKNPPRLERQGTSSPGLMNSLDQRRIENEKKMGIEKKPESKALTMALELLKNKKENLGKQLEIALKNLVDLRKRIGSRIEKDRLAGKDLSTVNALLKVADSKLLIAKQAVDAVKNYKPENSVQTATSTSTTRCLPVEKMSGENREDRNSREDRDDREKSIYRLSSSTSSGSAVRCPDQEKIVDLKAVRALVDKAQIAIKDAHRALNDVVVAIAKISGMNDRKERPATSTPASNGTPTNSPNISTSTNQ